MSKLLKRYAYINTSSEAGSPTEVTFTAEQVVWVRRWVNHYGNPSYTIKLDNGDTLYLVDDFGGTNDLRCDVHICRRRKDLFN